MDHIQRPARNVSVISCSGGPHRMTLGRPKRTAQVDTRKLGLNVCFSFLRMRTLCPIQPDGKGVSDDRFNAICSRSRWLEAYLRKNSYKFRLTTFPATQVVARIEYDCAADCLWEDTRCNVLDALVSRVFIQIGRHRIESIS